jgi:hypothetical protein
MRRVFSLRVCSLTLIVAATLAAALTLGLTATPSLTSDPAWAGLVDTATVPAPRQPALDITALQAQRLAQLQRRSQAVSVQLAVLAAIEAERLAELGYDPETATTPQQIARQMMQTWYGWGDDEFACFDKIITQESGWRWDAKNRSSGAYGIPQAKPGGKMASAGADWKTNPVTQIKWALGYVKQRYGTPCAASRFKNARGWY